MSALYLYIYISYFESVQLCQMRVLGLPLSYLIYYPLIVFDILTHDLTLTSLQYTSTSFNTFYYAIFSKALLFFVPIKRISVISSLKIYLKSRERNTI